MGKYEQGDVSGDYSLTTGTVTKFLLIVAAPFVLQVILLLGFVVSDRKLLWFI